MARLKVGDRVRLKSGTEGWHKFAREGTIIEVTDEGFTVQPDDVTNRPVPAIAEGELELTNTEPNQWTA